MILYSVSGVCLCDGMMLINLSGLDGEKKE